MSIQNLRVRPARGNNKYSIVQPFDAINDTYELTPNTIYSRAVGTGNLFAQYGSPAFAAEEVRSWGHFTTPITLATHLLIAFKLKVMVESGPVPPQVVDAKVRCWMMTTDWTPATLTWNLQPIFAGRSCDCIVQGDWQGGDFEHNREFTFFPRADETYYGMAIQVISSLSRATWWSSGEMRYPYNTIRPAYALQILE